MTSNNSKLFTERTCAEIPFESFVFRSKAGWDNLVGMTTRQPLAPRLALMTLALGQGIGCLDTMPPLSEDQSLFEVLLKVASYRLSDRGIVQLVL